jgi:hypothetical protein
MTKSQTVPNLVVTILLNVFNELGNEWADKNICDSQEHILMSSSEQFWRSLRIYTYCIGECVDKRRCQGAPAPRLPIG